MGKNTIIKIIAGICIVAGILTYAYWYGGDSYDYHSWSTSQAADNSATSQKEDSNAMSESIGSNIAKEPVTGGVTDSQSDVNNNVDSKSASSDESGSSDSSSAKDNSVTDSSITGSSTSSEDQTSDSKSSKNKSTDKDVTANDSEQDKESKDSEKSDNFQNQKAETDVGDSYDEKLQTTKKPVSTVSPVTQAPLATASAKPNVSTKTCTITISCADVLDNMSMIKPEKQQLIPSDGIFLKKVTVPIADNTTAFDVLKSVTGDKKIHMECSYTALYNSSYIEGIGNIYEFDCGPLSGWKYYVNDVCPSYGCSQYKLNDGDNLDFEFMCNAAGDAQ